MFCDVLVPGLRRVDPVDVVGDRSDRIQLLERFNFHWQDWTFGDIISPTARYSEEQKRYFAMLPKERRELLMRMKEGVWS